MFKRFHDKSHQLNSKTNNSQMYNQTYQQLSKRKSTIKSNYSQKFRAKIQSSQQKLTATLQLIKTDNFLYQGYLINQQKNGEGIMILKNGTTIIGKWQSDNLQGRALIFTSLGCKILANFIQGKLNGWVIAIYKRKLIKCILYYQNHLDGQKLTYDENQNIWVAAKCSYDGKLLSIIHAEKGSLMEIPSFIQSDELKYLLTSYILNSQHFVEFQNIQYIENSPTSSYIGYLDQQQKPSGLGVIYTDKELYSGNFFQGTLQHYGRILFENGEIYHGQMVGGTFWGKGIYYFPKKNETHILQSDENEQYIEKQLKGYVIIDINPSIGGLSLNNNKGFKNNTLQALQQSFQPYYRKQFAHQTSQNNQDDISGHSEFGHSEQMSRDHKTDKSKSDFNKASSLNPALIKPTQKWLKFGQDEDLQKDSYQRTFSLDKRQVAAMKKKQKFDIIKIKPPPHEYQSTQIKENLNKQQAGTFSKQGTFKGKIMEQIPFNNGFNTKKQGNSLEIDQINMRNNFQILQQQSKAKILDKMQIHSQISQSSSQMSQKSKKIQNLVERAKGYRKKIFY